MTIDRRATVIAAINHEETPLCPYSFGWDRASDIPERLDANYGSNEWRQRYRNYIVRVGLLEDGRKTNEEGPALRRNHYGSLWRTDLRPVHLEEPALQKPSLRGYTFPEPEFLFPAEWDQDVHAALAENSDCFTVLYPGFGLFERSWDLRGFANVLMDAASEPAFFNDLIAAVAEHFDKLLDHLLGFPVDGIFFGDDWGDQRGVIIGPERWREVFKPHYARLYAKAKASGKFVLHHSCGSVIDLVPDMIEIGLDVLESIQSEAREMNPYTLKDRFGEQLTFWGGLGSQSIIPNGTPQELRTEIKRLAAHMRQGGGYILAGAKDLQPETPTANAAAILEEFTALGEPAGA
ncbi:MAG: uroporphyrinogen decarboxylase family protein [Lentisphaeria bacterium]|jgi:uroporphyrinogen decarboxylase|nr:uroporphyrinogen decarboxylase family protein [Lentisphaeria bacterium]